MTETSIETDPGVVPSLETPVPDKHTPLLEHMPYIHHLVWSKKDQAEVQALLDSGNEINAMTPAYATRLGLKVRATDVRAQKIDGSTHQTFGIVLASF